MSLDLSADRVEKKEVTIGISTRRAAESRSMAAPSEAEKEIAQYATV